MLEYQVVFCQSKFNAYGNFIAISILTRIIICILQQLVYKDLLTTCGQLIFKSVKCLNDDLRSTARIIKNIIMDALYYIFWLEDFYGLFSINVEYWCRLKAFQDPRKLVIFSRLLNSQEVAFARYRKRILFAISLDFCCDLREIRAANISYSISSFFFIDVYKSNEKVIFEFPIFFD